MPNGDMQIERKHERNGGTQRQKQKAGRQWCKRVNPTLLDQCVPNHRVLLTICLGKSPWTSSFPSMSLLNPLFPIETVLDQVTPDQHIPNWFPIGLTPTVYPDRYSSQPNLAGLLLSVFPTSPPRIKSLLATSFSNEFSSIPF